MYVYFEVSPYLLVETPRILQLREAMAESSESICDQLKDLTLKNVKFKTSKVLGRGAYGKVFTVKHLGLRCAAKEIHPYLLSEATPAERKIMKDNFVRECYNSSSIRHPNIVQFIGVYYNEKLSDFPIMVMEFMDSNLTSYVDNNQSMIEMETKLSILHDVSLGLTHLHGRHPSVIHRDLSSNNVLLTKHLEAKISDLGMSKILTGDSKQTNNKLTKAPGTLHFMPPEALVDDPCYGTPVDVFSFAGVVLHLLSEEWPTPISQVMLHPETKQMVALTEADRRRQYLDKVNEPFGMKKMIESCLENDPSDRPLIKKVNGMIHSLMVCI